MHSSSEIKLLNMISTYIKQTVSDPNNILDDNTVSLFTFLFQPKSENLSEGTFVKFHFWYKGPSVS